MEEQNELCIQWDPIPHEYNRLSHLGVTSFGEVGDETTEGVACIISSSLPDDVSRRRRSWRIFFPMPWAYRLRPIGDWKEALPITWPPASWSVSGNSRVALWELTSSTYLAQSADQDDRRDARHYVLMNHDMAYEVIALAYRVDDLGE